MSSEKMQEKKRSIEQLLDVVETLKMAGVNKSYLKNSVFLRSLLRFLAIKGVEADRMKAKIEECSNLIHRCTNTESSMKMWASVYNYKVKSENRIEVRA